MTKSQTVADRPTSITNREMMFEHIDEHYEVALGLNRQGAFPLESMAAGTSRYYPGYASELVMLNDEVLYVIDGQLEFICADQSDIVGPGGLIYLPKGMQVKLAVHTPSLIFWVGHSSADVSAMLESVRPQE